MKSKLLVLLQAVLLLPAGAAFGQKVEDYDNLRQKYSNENAVFVSRKEDVVVKIENNQPVIYSNISEDLLLLTDKASSYMERHVYWSDFSEIQNMNAYTLVPEGKKYKTMKVTEFGRTNEISDYVFYDDTRAFHFVFPGLVNGAHAVYSYTEKLNDPHLFGRFFFNSFAPAEDVEYSITFPSNVKIRYTLFNNSDSLIKFSSKVSGKNTTYTWTLHGAKEIKSEDESPNISYYTPHIVALVDEYTVNGQTKKVLSDVSSLYDWYYGFVKDVNTSVAPELKKVVDSITAGVTDSLEKVKRIFAWVQNNITYIAYEDSLGGVIPREASLVCSRRFGDCKDMASTLTEMIRAAGLPAYQTWIGSRDIPYHFSDVPSPIATNHMICTYIQDGKKYFMDATGKDAPFGYFTSMIQGKDALIGMGKDKYEVATVPEMDMNNNILSDTTHFKLDVNTHIQGEGVVEATGYDKIIIGRRVQNMEQKERRTYLVGLLQKGNNKFNVDSLSYDNLTDRNKELGIHYNFSLDNYAQQNGNEIYVNMALDKEYMNDLIEPDRVSPREIEYKNIKKNVNILQIPAGYKISYLPENSSFKGDNFGFDIRYTVKGNTIINEKSVYINTLMLTKKDFDQWNKMIKQLTKAYNETVTLVKQ